MDSNHQDAENQLETKGLLSRMQTGHTMLQRQVSLELEQQQCQELL
jgi:hypothetical protein